ncbi:uncharacterized protein LOC126812572 [Patella vulgata]|uniref:uncharacterized protein LOC126812572 n=1 Tax=Patella vulgata TaxID=6465 RepID=UPI0024A9A020|nr:uncharacterized protein LOC126812572 [Patella vulgata]
MASPLIILFINAGILGVLASVFVVLAISVNSWQKYEYKEDKLAEINRTENHLFMKNISADNFFLQVEDSSTSGLNTNEERDIIPRSSLISNRECFTFVTDFDESNGGYSSEAKQIARLQNSAASCYIVVIIDLISAAIVGLIGITQKQVASCMVTGVLYCMAALFGVFGLSMFHTKDYYEKFNCYSLTEIPTAVCPARVVTIDWAIPVAWCGVLFCVLACTLWLIVARALRVIKAKTML